MVLDEVKGKEITLTVQSNNKTKKVKAMPKLNDESGKYELGLWVKDSSAGVGMVTFYELTHKYFAALGHGITETSKNIVLPIQSGAIVKSKITSINKGLPKQPGDIRGTIYKDVYGQIRKNTINGIYGSLENTEILNQKQVIKAAYKNEIKTKNAKKEENGSPFGELPLSLVRFRTVPLRTGVPAPRWSRNRSGRCPPLPRARWRW